MKKIASLSIALLLVAALAVTAFAANAGDLGWNGDGTTAGWEVAEDGTVSVDRAAAGATHRVWKEVILDPNNFVISANVTAGAGSSPYVKVMGIRIDMDARGGNGNQFFPKFLASDWVNWDEDITDDQNGAWIDGTMNATLKFERVNGGDMTISLTAGDKVLTTTVAPTETGNLNIEIGNEAGGTAATFANIVVPQAPVNPPVDPEPENPKTGDMVGVAVALLAVSGAALVVLKKKD